MESWVASFQQASAEIASQTLRFDPTTGPKDVARMEGRCPGAYIALLGDRTSVHLGISASPDGCRAIARGLLGAHRSSEIDDRDVTDAMSEVLNIVAGKVKSLMIQHDPSLKLGLPMFVTGEIRLTDGMEKGSAVTRMGPVECELTVYRRALAA